MADTAELEPATAEEAIGQVAARGPAFRRMAFALLMAGFSTFGLLYDCQPLLPLFAHRFGVSAATSSLTVSLSTGAMALVFIPAGVLSDRIGRKRVMVVSLFASAVLTLLSALLPGWTGLLVMRALIGLALAGVPSVAMAYIAEEVAPSAVGAMMGLYVSGTAIGGMSGRLGMTVIAQWLSWRVALAVMGAAGLAAAVVFLANAPAARAFTPVRHDARSLLASIRRLLGDRVLPLLYLEAFLLMGAFVTVYNYAGFRLEAAPYRLSQAEVGSVFLLYLLGSYSSAAFGALAGRLGRTRVFWAPVALLIAGVLVTTAKPLWAIILGVAIVTVSFFAAHSTASGWVGARAGRDKAQGSALYLLFYYAGSSLVGSAGGIAWSRAGWSGVAGFCTALAALALGTAVLLGRREPHTPSARASLRSGKIPSELG